MALYGQTKTNQSFYGKYRGSIFGPTIADKIEWYAYNTLYQGLEMPLEILCDVMLIS